jgi:hypothetical protein
MSDPTRRFDPRELEDPGAPLSDAEAAELLATARDLETFAASQSVAPTAGFEDRVMVAIADEPPPKPVLAGGFLGGIVATVRDSWRILWSGDRPLAIRAQALAIVLVAALAVGAVGTAATVGALTWLQGNVTDSPEPSPSLPIPSVVPTPSVVPSPPPSPTLTPSPPPSPSPSPSPSETTEPSETPEGTDDNGGSGSGSGDDSGSGNSGSGSGSSGSGGSGNSGPGGGGDDDHTPKPDDTPDPDETPDPD